MKNIPNKIYIQIGEEATKDDDFNKLELSGGVTYCTDRINKNDLVYYRRKRKINSDKIKENKKMKTEFNLEYSDIFSSEIKVSSQKKIIGQKLICACHNQERFIV